MVLDKNHSDTNAAVNACVCICVLRLDLAQRSHGTIVATAAALVVANRQSGEVVDAKVLAAGEAFWGRAVLECIARHEL